MPLLMAISEGCYLWTKRPVYLELSKRWAAGTAIMFAVGAVSGTVLSFELGLLWPNFMKYAGALPWPIAASIVRPSEKVISISGDGGFLFSAMELETAVRLKANIVHLVWIDGTYDMVAVQEVLKYGRKSGIELGPVDLVKYAEAFGATGKMIRTPDEIGPIMREALNHTGPIIIGVPVDYSDNHKLFEMVREDSIH